MVQGVCKTNLIRTRVPLFGRSVCRTTPYAHESPFRAIVVQKDPYTHTNHHFGPSVCNNNPVRTRILISGHWCAKGPRTHTSSDEVAESFALGGAVVSRGVIRIGDAAEMRWLELQEITAG